MFIALVPAYNEAKHIGQVVQDLLPKVDEVVVIDDCSHDATVETAQAAGATVLRHTLNRGQGAALETGHAYARSRNADFVLHFDGDGQFDVEDIAPALAHLQNAQADIVLGSRFLDARSQVPWFKRQVLLPVGRFINTLIIGLNLTDVHNGFRLLNRRALDKIVIRQDRMAHATEIPALIKTQQLRHIEYPVKVTYHHYGQRLSGGIRILQDLLLGRFVE